MVYDIITHDTVCYNNNQTHENMYHTPGEIAKKTTHLTTVDMIKNTGL